MKRCTRDSGSPSDPRPLDISPVMVDLATTAIVPDIQLQVPAVRLEVGPSDQHRLEWSGREATKTPSVQSCFWRFIELAAGTEDDILDFAQTWGVLRIGTDGYPQISRSNDLLTDRHRYWQNDADTSAQARVTPHEEHGSYWEPISAWRYFSRRMRALLAIYIDLRTDVPTRMEDWLDAAQQLRLPKSSADLVEFYSRSTVDDFNAFRVFLMLSDGLNLRSTTDQRRLLNFLANELIEHSRLSPALTEKDGIGAQIGVAIAKGTSTEPGRTPGTPPPERAIGVYDILAGQFLAAIQSPSTFRCSVCSKPYLINPGERRPRGDRRHFCSPECRHEARLEVLKASDRLRSEKRKQTKHD
jgi:hypothetical protein